MKIFLASNFKRTIGAAIFCFFIIYIAALGIIPLTEPSEARYALIASSMAKSGDFVTPMLKETPYLEKPPLTYWASALIFKLFGESDFTARLFSGLCAWGCILLVFFIGSHLYSRRVGIYSAAILATSLYHFLVGRLNLLDMPLAFFVSLAVWWGYRYLRDEQKAEQKKKFIYGFYLVSALAFLTKGLVGVIIPFAVLSIWLIFTKRWRDIPRLVSPWGLVIFLAVSLPWLVLVQRAQSDFLYFFFVQEHLFRFTTKMHNRYKPFYYFIPILLFGFIPWLGYLAQAGKAWSGRHFGRGADIMLLWIWAGFIFLFFSVSSSKLVPYIAPVFIPFAVVLGRFFAAYDAEPPEKQSSWWRDYLPQILQSLVLLVALGVALVLHEYEISHNGFWVCLSLSVISIILLAFLPNYIKAKFGAGWFLTIAVLGFLMMVFLLLPASRFLTPYKTAIPINQTVARFVPADEPLYQFRTCIYGVDFYTKKRTPLIEETGELGTGVAKLSPEERKTYFLVLDEAFELCKSGKRLFIIVENAEKYSMLKEAFPDAHLLWSNKKYFLVSVEKLKTK